MRVVELRGALLTTSSVVALIVGIGSAQAGPSPASCAVNNTFVGLPNSGAINCVSFNDGANHTGDVVNNSTGTITATTPYPPINPGTSSGISVLGTGTKLTGNITNSGTITAPFVGINIGAGAHGIPPTTSGIGATVTGTITNNGTITGPGAGIEVDQSSVGGSIINNKTITTNNVGIYVTGVAGHLSTIGGSITNNGTIVTQGNDGMFVQFATVGGSFTNTKSIDTTALGGSGAMILSSSSLTGSITNSGTLSAKVVGIDVLSSSVGGSVTNSGGTINAEIGIAFTGQAAGKPVTITGNVTNSGTINASTFSGISVSGYKGGVTISGGIFNSGTINATLGTGIGLYGATITGGVSNNGGTITAKGVGILVGSTSQAAGATSITGGVSNSGTISGKTGILVTGGATVAGGITNSGSLSGTTSAIDVTGEGAAITINQQAGTITGNILLSTNADIVNITGGAISGNIVGQGSSNTVNFALGSGTFTYANDISGVNVVNVTSGTVQLTGTNTYTGTTNVNGGILDVQGSIASSSLTTVNSGGVLTGTGTVGNTTVASGGEFAPGSGTPGTFMTVSGNLAFASGALYMVQLNPTTASYTSVTGTAMLGGATVDAVYASGSYIAKQYTILTSTGALSGTFTGPVNTNLPSNFTASLSYDAHDAYLNLTLNFIPPPGSGLNQNQQNVANAIVNYFNTHGSIPLVFGGLTAAGLTQVSGESATGTQQTTFDAMSQFMGLLTDPVIGGRGTPIAGGSSATPFTAEIDAANAYAAKDPARSKSEREAYAAIYRKVPPPVATFVPSWSVWTAGFGGSQTTSGNTVVGSNSTTSSLGAVAVGADYRFSPDTIAGFAMAGGGTSFNVSGLGSGRSDLFQAGAFVRHTEGPAYFTAALAYGWQNITTDRIVTVAGFDHLRAQFNANAFSGRIEDGYRFATPWMGVTPYAAAQFTTFDLPSYAEQAIVGANTFALAYGAKSVTDVRSEIGVRTDKSWAMTDSILTLRGRLAWAHDYDPDRSIGATFQTLPGASFVVNGAAQLADKALTSASAEVKWRNGFSLAATFEGEFTGNSSSYAGKGIARYTW
jgi:uncharacterized protein with beta-barrel porin domain